MNPKILLLDEPFSALDPSTRQKMYEEIRRIHKEFNCTIVFVTHDFSEAQTLADNVGIILHGELEAIVEADKLFEKEFEDKDIKEFLRGQA